MILAYGGAQLRYGGSPDLTVYGKFIGGGLPVAVVGGRAEFMAMLDPTDGKARVECRQHVSRTNAFVESLRRAVHQ